MPRQAGVVIGGVDTHKHTHHTAAIDGHGQLLADREFATGARDQDALLAWLRSHGEIAAIGIEGTGFYGAARTRHLSGAGLRVVEVNLGPGGLGVLDKESSPRNREIRPRRESRSVAKREDSPFCPAARYVGFMNRRAKGAPGPTHHSA